MPKFGVFGLTNQKARRRKYKTACPPRGISTKGTDVVLLMNPVLGATGRSETTFARVNKFLSKYSTRNPPMGFKVN